VNVSEDGSLGQPLSCKRAYQLTVAVRPLLHVTHSQSCGRATSPFILCFALFCDEKLSADAQSQHHSN
jgi:hypothetical protein